MHSVRDHSFAKMCILGENCVQIGEICNKMLAHFYFIFLKQADVEMYKIEFKIKKMRN